jgi:beta-alanine degradation protein BauB
VHIGQATAALPFTEPQNGGRKANMLDPDTAVDEDGQSQDTSPNGTNPRAHWPEALQREFDAQQFSGIVGSVLVSETERVRVWHLRLPAGQRCGFHRHVLDYFWTVHGPGKARGYFGDGRIVDVEHHTGETRHFTFGKGEFFVHSVENIGETDLLFTTVEFLGGANAPLPIPAEVRLDAQSPRP